MKGITNDEKSQILEFLIKKDVIYFELQCELLDHICSDIENKRKKNPEISFSLALEESYRDFGIFGFSDILEEREKLLNRNYYSRFLGLLKPWFFGKNIWKSIILILAIYQMISTDYGYSIALGIISVVAVVHIGSSFYWVIKNKRNNRPKVMMDKVIAQSIMLVMNIPFQMLIPIFWSDRNPFITVMPLTIIQLYIFTPLIFVFLLLTYYLAYEIPKNKEKYFEEKYQVLKYAG
jgi:hypothetical protein